MLSFEPVSLHGGAEVKSNKVAAASESIEKDAVELGILSEGETVRASPVSKREAGADENRTLLGLLEQVVPVDLASTNDAD